MSRTASGLQVVRSAAALLVTVAVLLVTACASTSAVEDATPSAEGERPVIAVSFPILADIVRNVAGSRAEVWSVIPRSGDPHTYQATAQDLSRLHQSDLLITVGGHLERFLEAGSWRRTAREAGLDTLEVAEEVDLIVRDMVIDHGDHTHDLREGDPHFWLDPTYTLDVIAVVRDALVTLDPNDAEAYRAQADAYADEVRAADAHLASAIEEIPLESRVLVVHHDAYTYLTERFGFRVLGYVLPNAGAGEPSAQGIADLQQIIRTSGVPAVFREPQFEAAILNQLAEDEGITVGVLVTDVLTDDAPTYLDLIRFNANSLRQQLAP